MNHSISDGFAFAGSNDEVILSEGQRDEAVRRVRNEVSHVVPVPHRVGQLQVTRIEIQRIPVENEVGLGGSLKHMVAIGSVPGWG